MNYWLDLFTGTTWNEFQKAGGRVTGFCPHNRKRAANIRPGDVFLCYVTGVKRWVGLLEATGELHHKPSGWAEEVFPVRLPVKSLVILGAESGVPIKELQGNLTFLTYETPSGLRCRTLRGSPTRYEKPDWSIRAPTFDSCLRPAERQSKHRFDGTVSLTFRRFSASRKGISVVEVYI